MVFLGVFQSFPGISCRLFSEFCICFPGLLRAFLGFLQDFLQIFAGFSHWVL